MNMQSINSITSKSDNPEVVALLEDYNRISTQILEFKKLQYQLVGVTYAIGGAALTLWGTSIQPKPFAILFFPPLFCAIVLVQLYLHSHIKSSARFINFRLRPRMEAIINSGSLQHPSFHVIWDWEEYYVQSHAIPRFIIRKLGSVIILLALIPALASIFIFFLMNPLPLSALTFFEQLWLWIDFAMILLTLFLFFFVHMINEKWWNVEKEERAKQNIEG